MATKDAFRREQKKMCVSGAPNHVGIYGCSCCRMLSDKGDFKKASRKLAKARFRQMTKGEILKTLKEEPDDAA